MWVLILMNKQIAISVYANAEFKSGDLIHFPDYRIFFKCKGVTSGEITGKSCGRIMNWWYFRKFGDIDNTDCPS